MKIRKSMDDGKPTSAFQLPWQLDLVLTRASQHEKVDKAAILERWLRKGALDDAMTLIGKGTLSEGMAAEALGMHYLQVVEERLKRGIELGVADPEEHQQLWDYQMKAIEEEVGQRNAEPQPKSKKKAV